MARIVDVNTWEEFESKLALLELDMEKRAYYHGTATLHFRGHANSGWSLTTTLERYTTRPFSFGAYHSLMGMTLPQVETFVGEKWEFLSPKQMQEWLHAIPQTSLPGYDYMIYLRHHGFPSPLLDWTRSPYIAAHFAFHRVDEKTERIAIFVYCEYPRGHKIGGSDQANITGLGPYIRSHRRHFNQQSEYTICTKTVNGTLFYTSHEDAFVRNDEEQELLYKFTIPSTERGKVLKKLDRYNINACSLFGSEESLMETLALREIFFREDER